MDANLSSHSSGSGYASPYMSAGGGVVRCGKTHAHSKYIMEPEERFELSTYRLQGDCSGQLSYSGMARFLSD